MEQDTVQEQLPQPWLNADGTRVRGTQLTDDLAAILSLEEEAMPSRRALIIMSWHLKTATLVGNPAPIVAKMSDRTRHPLLGDLVVESTQGPYAAQHQRGDWYRALGILIARREEWAYTDEDWRAELYREPGLDEGDRIHDNFAYIQYGPSPDDICRWSNYTLEMVPLGDIKQDWS